MRPEEKDSRPHWQPHPLRPEDERDRYYAIIRRKLTMKRLTRVSWVNVAVVLTVMLAFFLGCLLMEKPKTSAVEKRDLARFPAFSAKSLFSGEYTREIELWFSDTFPFRDGFVALSAVTDEAYGVRVDDVRILAPAGGEAQDMPSDTTLSAASQAQPQQADTQSTPAAESISSQEASQPESAPSDINNGTFVYQGRAMSLFGGSDANCEWYAQVLNKYHEELPDVQIYDMVIPTAIEFYVPEKYRKMTQSQKDTIDLIYSKLDPAVKTVDAYSMLDAHKDEYIYFRTDHHWTGLGAYYAYTAFCEQAGFRPMKISDFETRRLDNFIGTMYAQTQDTTLLKNPDYVDYYIFKEPYTAMRYKKGSPYRGDQWTLWGEYAQSPNSYSVFLHGDFPLLSIRTANHNGRKAMVVKESFGNAFAPFLINHYEEVYIVDQRYFELSAADFIRENGITDLIFANNVFAACTPYHIRCIDQMRNQAYRPVVAAPAVPVPESESESESASIPEEEPEEKPAKSSKTNKLPSREQSSSETGGRRLKLSGANAAN